MKWNEHFDNPRAKNRFEGKLRSKNIVFVGLHFQILLLNSDKLNKMSNSDTNRQSRGIFCRHPQNSIAENWGPHYANTCTLWKYHANPSRRDKRDKIVAPNFCPQQCGVVPACRGGERSLYLLNCWVYFAKTPKSNVLVNLAATEILDWAEKIPAEALNASS